MSGEHARRYAKLRIEPMPFEWRSRDQLDMFPRPTPTLVGQVVTVTFDLPPTGAGIPDGLTLELQLDIATYRSACTGGVWGLGAALEGTPPAGEPADGIGAEFDDTRPINVLLRADLAATGRARFSGLDLADDDDLREAFASVLGDGRGNVFHAIESWRAVAVRQFLPDRPPVGFDLARAGGDAR